MNAAANPLFTCPGDRHDLSGQANKIGSESHFQLCAAALVVQAGAGSRAEAWCRTVLELGKPVWTVDEPENAHLVALGARPFNLDSLPSFFA
jgi:hypothetical protein